MKKILFVSLISILFIFSVLYSHAGRLDSSGGHRDSKTGKYHYHQTTVKSTPAPAPKPKENLASRKGIYISDNKTKIEILENGNAKWFVVNDKEYNFKIGESTSTSTNFVIPLLSIDKEYKNVRFIFISKDTFTAELNTSTKYKFIKQK